VNTLTVIAVALAAGMLFQAQGFTQDAAPSGASADRAPAAADSEAAAREIWRSFVANNPAPGKGCFHLSYPNYSWDSVDCKQTTPRAHPPAGAPAGAAGNHYDYVAGSSGLISFALGTFITNDVESVTSVGGAANEGGNPILGPNEYSLQINTNSNGNTSACDKQPACTVWQQFMYATDYNGKGEAALFMQYWLQQWTGTCPKGWTTQPTSNDTGTKTSCYKNQAIALPLPDIPIANLGNVTLNASATPGGNDTLSLTYRTDESFEAWQVSAEDSPVRDKDGTLLSGLDISSVWNDAEFNVLGDMEYAQAAFNAGASITVQISVGDGSNSAPACLGPSGFATTGESNNLNLDSCRTGASYIEFTESVPPPGPLCLPPSMEIDGKCTPKGGLPQ
jgi:hypothetical protein